MTKEKFNNLIQEAINAGYLLSEQSCDTLASNFDIVFNSIKGDMNTVIYASPSIFKSYPEIFKYLFKNGYEFTKIPLGNKPLQVFNEQDTMKYALKMLKGLDKENLHLIIWGLEKYPDSIDNYIERLSELYVKAINTVPTIKSLKSVLQIFAESSWQEHYNRGECSKVFNKICAELKYNDDYNEAITHLNFLDKMQKTLNDKYYLLLEAMLQYHTTIHNNSKSETIDFFRDQIAELSSLYASIRKENYENEILEKYFEYIKKYFIPRKEHPIIHKKLIEHKYKNKFTELYQNGDNDICNFLEGIVKRYNSDIDNDTAWSMIDSFLYDDISETNSNESKNELLIFENIKQQIILKARKLKINNEISDAELTAVASELPFDDEYFEFSKETSSCFCLKDFLDACTLKDHFINATSLLDDEAYSILKNYAINNGLFWLMLLIPKFLDEYEKTILTSFDYVKEASSLAKLFKYDINKYENALSLCRLSEFADDKTIAILGKDLIFKLFKDQRFSYNRKTVVENAKELVCEMVKRDKATVPYVDGKVGNCLYSMYEPQDETILSAGIDTHTSFKIYGTQNDFLHYCTLSKNGFVIKITDTVGKTIGVAPGIRNGNCIYIDGVDTIYGYSSLTCKKEKKEIIETFYQACNDIVRTSQNNMAEKDKIDFIFVNKGSLLRDIKSNVNLKTKDRIGRNPIDTESGDWKDFIANTKNLLEINGTNDVLSTSLSMCYTSTDLLCAVSSKKIFNRTKNIKFKDVEALYTVPRSKIIATENPDVNIINKINKINGIYSYINKTDFEGTTLPQGTVTFLGDNWYVAYNNGDIFESCVLNFDKKAIIEYETTKKVLEKFTLKNNQQDIREISQQIELNSKNVDVKVLRLNR